MEVEQVLDLCRSKPGQLIVRWLDYITLLVVRVSTLLIIGIPYAQTQCDINPLRGNPFHYELTNTNPSHVRKFRERRKLLRLSAGRASSIGNRENSNPHGTGNCGLDGGKKNLKMLANRAQLIVNLDNIITLERSVLFKLRQRTRMPRDFPASFCPPSMSFLSVPLSVLHQSNDPLSFSLAFSFLFHFHFTFNRSDQEQTSSSRKL